jgi:PBSX family phage terminase large subunit
MSGTLELNWHHLSEQQEAFLSSKKTIKAFIGGIGSGKTTIGCMACILEALGQTRSTGLILAATYRLLEDSVLPELRKWLPDELIKDYNASRYEFTLTNGSVIRLRSGDDQKQIDRLRGQSLAFAFLDEAALLPEDAFKIILGRLRQPNMRHRCFVCSTPRGKRHWIYQYFVEHPKKNMFLVTAPTESNKNLPPRYIEMLKEQYVGRFAQQELQGTFVEFDDLLVYPGFKSEMIMDSSEAETLKATCFGLDWGWRHPSAVVAAAFREDKCYILEEHVKREEPLEDLIEVIKDMQKRWGYGRVFCDPSEPGSLETLRKAGIDAVKGDNNVGEGIRAVASYIENGKFFVHESCKNLINELQTYSYIDATGNRVLKQNDDCCDALRYAVMGGRGVSQTYWIDYSRVPHISAQGLGRI